MGLQIGSGDQTRASHFVEEKEEEEEGGVIWGWGGGGGEGDEDGSRVYVGVCGG